MTNLGHSSGVQVVQDTLQAIVEHRRVISEARAAELSAFLSFISDACVVRAKDRGFARLGYRLSDVLDWIDERLSDAA
jgi:hypothetical protein